MKLFYQITVIVPLLFSSLLFGWGNPLEKTQNQHIKVFEKSKEGVVYISTLKSVIDYHTLRYDRIPRGTGSGFIWDKEGHVITNFHVIANGDGAKVKLSNGKSYNAILVGYSKKHDLAVLKIETPNNNALHPLPKGSSKELKVGQIVYAIGNPFGLDWTMTSGIISALERNLYHIPHVRIRHAIQTDAAINPGNSGGPLLDIYGRVIGVNSALYSPSGAYAGIGFSIPIDIVTRVVSQIIKKGYYEPALIGIYSDDRINRYIRGIYGKKGVAILDLMPKSGLHRAGVVLTKIYGTGEIALGDLITHIDGKRVGSLDEIATYLDNKNKGDQVTLTLQRGNKKRKVSVRLY